MSYLQIGLAPLRLVLILIYVLTLLALIVLWFPIALMVIPISDKGSKAIDAMAKWVITGTR